MKRLVADTGPLLHLHQAGATHLLSHIGRVFVPSTVLAELRVHAPLLWPAELPEWLNRTSLSAETAQRASAWQQAGLLHRGEAESLALACELRPDWFLTDDAAARLFAEALGVETHGSLGLVLWAAATHLIRRPEAETLLTGLENSSLWLSRVVRAQARAALAQIYSSI
jgi:predicted nucleic acid-binding protein